MRDVIQAAKTLPIPRKACRSRALQRRVVSFEIVPLNTEISWVDIVTSFCFFRITTVGVVPGGSKRCKKIPRTNSPCGCCIRRPPDIDRGCDRAWRHHIVPGIKKPTLSGCWVVIFLRRFRRLMRPIILNWAQL